LTVYEFKYCYAISLGVSDEEVKSYSTCVGSGALCFGGDDEAFVEGGVV
jgi:hypothetical protein